MNEVVVAHEHTIKAAQLLELHSTNKETSTREDMVGLLVSLLHFSESIGLDFNRCLHDAEMKVFSARWSAIQTQHNEANHDA